MPAISSNFGQTGDEDVEAIYGRDIYNYWTKGDKQALNYDQHSWGANIKGMEFYGGMFDFGTEAIHQMFPSWHIMNIRHFVSSVFGALLMIFTGLIAYRLSHKKWMVAVLGLLFILFSPRIFGESMNNGKDIPFAAGFAMGLYYLIRILQDISIKPNLWKEALLLGLSWGIVFGMRSAGALLFVGYVGIFLVVYYVFDKRAKAQLFEHKKGLLKKLLLYCIVACVIGYVLGILTWPFGLQSPVSNLFVALKEMTHRETVLRVLFEGKYTSSNKLPWYYEFKWIILTSPIIVLLLVAAFLVLLFRAIKTYSLFAVFLLLFSAVFPILYIIYKKSNVYDTWRHVFFVYPYWVIMAALAVDMLQSFLKEKLKWVPAAVAIAGLLPTMSWTVSAHPNQYVYFNAIAGGTKGAFGYYDLDYYLVSGKQSAEWVLRNVKRPPPGQKIKVLTNMEGMDFYLGKDTSWIYTTYARYYERNEKDWDYYITYGRFVSEWQLQNGKWPPANVVYSIDAGGVPIGVVLQSKSKDAYLAHEALKKNDFNTAASLYASYIKTDTSDEMVYYNYAVALASIGKMDEAIVALKSAIALNPTRPDFYQILSQIYKAKGDNANAQEAYNRAMAIMLQQQEEAGEE
jgi:hypothetical protein